MYISSILTRSLNQSIVRCERPSKQVKVCVVSVGDSARSSLAFHCLVFVPNKSVYITFPLSTSLVEPCNIALTHRHTYLAFALIVSVVAANNNHMRGAYR